MGECAVKKGKIKLSSRQRNKLLSHAARKLVWYSSAVFILEDALSVWMKWSKLLLFVWQCVSSTKTGTRRIARLDEIPFVVRHNGSYSCCAV